MSRQNGISIEDMLKLEVMESCKLIAGFRGARNTISRVNIMADPDILEWTTEGEFLLTTAYSFKKDTIESQKELIKECASKNLAGLGIKISPYLENLSQEVLDLANDLSFPIIDINYSIPLSDIMMVTFREIFNKQASLLERIEKVHEKLMGAMLEGNGLENLVEIVRENIKNPVILHLNFSNETIKALEGSDPNNIHELCKEVKEFYEHNNNKSKLKKLIEDKVIIDGKYIKRMIMPIVLREHVYGHLFAWGTDMPIGGFDLAIIESASTTIALSILQELSIKEVEIRYRSEFFEDLISIDSKRKRKALDRARFFNLQLEDSYVIEVMSFKHKNEDDENELMVNYIQDFINPMVHTIEEFMNYLNLKGIVSTKANGIQILLSFTTTDFIQDKIKEFNQKILESIRNKSDKLDVKIGIGRVYKKLENVDKSFQDAVRTVRIGKIITTKEIVTFDELGIFKILSEEILKDELEDFYNSTLKPLVDYDSKKSTELVKTLDVYFKNNGNLTRISEQLFTHYNTVLYRINRITEITKMDLEDPNHRLNLEIALKIKELLDK
ncbi:PucR family transcriptional regulator ligand-binding domain-containing protein [Tissierella pigra]|uniref:PucR family transcriptional regulator n=1 Tax=Tissierella pigra TaxID=2607614 RepID=A0A6N7XFN9_9FIRM|nr:PucR family transcriptional regulator ligand-binding domain-containing protein [Tissierella pigra]MBU5425416.1 PucR family transcriptional regulator ligand-binding domain-containing protein [Tissierella pigra]MSU00536.1 PucR family transcriptional regulator [Tissierella pigra]